MIYGYLYPNPRFCDRAAYNSNQMNYFLLKRNKKRLMEETIKLDENSIFPYKMTITSIIIE